MAKTGRPRSNDSRVYGPDGEEKLHMRKDSQGNYYARWKDEKGKWCKKNLGRSESKAFLRYAKWEAEQKGEQFSIIPKANFLESLSGKAKVLLKEDVYDYLEQEGKDPSVFLMDIIDRINIEEIEAPDSYIWQRARELVYSDPRKASEILDIPYENLIGIKPKKNYTLEEIGNLYFNRIELQGNLTTNQKSEKSKTKKSWERFIKAVGKRTIFELGIDEIKSFYDDVYSEYQDNNWSTTWLKGHFNRVKGVLNYACDNLDFSEELSEVRRLCRNKLKSNENIVQNSPYRIKKKEFHKLLKVSNNEEKAMWLLSMNCAYYTIDVSTVPISAFDWEEKTVIFKRGKMKKRGLGNRAAILWDNTIDAIKLYLEETKHRKRKTLFISNFGQPYVENRIRKKFVSVREKANLNHIDHRNFRDSFESIGQKERGIQNSVDAVMGHTPKGNRGEYIDPELVPEIAESACKAVYKYYFG